MSSLVITNEAARRVAKGDPWFYDDDVVGRMHRLPSIVRLLDKRRRFVGQAFCSPGSRPYLRLIATSDETIDRQFWRRRIRAAFDRRAPLFGVTDAFRVVHAEADRIPAVVIDKFGDVWSMQVTASGAEAIKGLLAEIIVEEFAPATIIEKNSCSARSREGLSTIDRIAYGEQGIAVIREKGERFEVNVLLGQKTGAYLDYRAIRFKGGEFAFGRCLDAFCYQGWFACHAAGSAKSVVAVDSSAPAIEAAKRNAELNGHSNISFVKDDVFDYLEGQRKTFDFIHLDPPSFAKGGGSAASARAGYRRLLASALKLLAAGGTVMVSSCSHAVTERILEEALTEALKRAGRGGEIIFRGRQDADHPVLKGHPESLYLKAIAAKMRG